MSIANEPTCKRELDSPPQLLILDLNGALVSRVGRVKSEVFGMYVRPSMEPFLDYIFKHFKVMVWSSAQPESVDRMCRLFGDLNNDLILKWNRCNFGLSQKEFHRKTQTIKNLEKVWEALDNAYDATNTVIIDDSAAKSVLQPYNSIHIGTFDHLSPIFRKYGDNELVHVISYLEGLRSESNVANAIKTSPYTIPSHTSQDITTESYYFNDFRKEPTHRQYITWKRKDDTA